MVPCCRGGRTECSALSHLCAGHRCGNPGASLAERRAGNWTAPGLSRAAAQGRPPSTMGADLFLCPSPSFGGYSSSMADFSWDLPYPSQRMPVLARNVVATSQPLAAQAGLQMLRAGGNAADAAVATAITLTVIVT